MVGDSLRDIMSGNGGNDTLLGDAGNDQLDGGIGNDFLNGGAGADQMFGRAGHDTYVVDSTGDRISEPSGAGRDVVRATVSFALSGGLDNLLLLGAAGLQGKGNALANTIVGNAGGNKLFGFAGNDRLDGKAGTDVLTGGLGRDLLLGGAARDVFDYNSVKESGRTSATRDQIVDFRRGVDDIDLRTIDANAKVGGNNAFSFIGTAAFDGLAGQLRIKDLGSNVIAQADVNGDMRSDFEILVKGVGLLGRGDFLL